MKITIESTEHLVEVDGVLTRMWHGETARGNECILFVAAIAAPENQQNAEFEAELAEIQMGVVKGGTPC